MYKTDRDKYSMQKYLYEQFLSEGPNCLSNVVEITFIVKIDLSDRTRREEFCRTKLKTSTPYDLNFSGSFCFGNYNSQSIM